MTRSEALALVRQYVKNEGLVRHMLSVEAAMRFYAEKFGEDNVSYTYRIVYRSNERTLTTEEIEPIQNKVIEETKKQFGAEIR